MKNHFYFTIKGLSVTLKDLIKFQSSVNEWYGSQISFLNKYAKEDQILEQSVKTQKLIFFLRNNIGTGAIDPSWIQMKTLFQAV